MKEKLFRPVDNSPLVIFRVIFGLLLTAEAWGAIMTGWVKKAFITPKITFPFIDFSWLHPLPGDGMYYYYIIMGVAGVLVMLGLYYRVAMITYALMWAGVYFMQKTNYNNHYYLMVLLCFLMSTVPAHKYLSLDVKRKPSLKSLSCPQWCIWAFAFQMTLVYVFAAFAKMYPGWMEAETVGILFTNKSHYWLIGPLLAQKWFQVAVSHMGLVFDLFVGPGLLWKKTRKYAFMAAVFFHLFNSAVFQVGVFPYVGIAISIFFFDPETIRRIFLKRKPPLELNEETINSYKSNYLEGRKKLVTTLFVGYFICQVLLPLRHWLFTGDVNWTEEGHRISWRMMLRIKYGTIMFHIKDPATGETWKVRPTEYLTPKQAGKVASHPDMCWQFVQILKKEYADKGFPDVEIYARGNVRLNRGDFHPLYDPEYNLAKAEWHHFKHAEWLLPFKQD
ncbi:HTTM domain-containing protein [Fulvivirga maritima]|uniref:HTTM domain-containing protein n=1 Tax=Fulvivirga maritima TaxID=2904247 RepID=UPI001F2C4DE0|nr:HTTM domain-containing protein [Fulvivirga maritima]UII28400.1 HTTM domain-containing protein [Fulvivirga maritima]